MSQKTSTWSFLYSDRYNYLNNFDLRNLKKN
jgi:hypothetical protein